MILPDVNVLINAFRPDTLHHNVCRSWLERTLEDNVRFGMSPLALAAVVRITTHSRPFNVPSTLEEAYRFCEYLLDQPHCEIIEPGARHWGIFRRLSIETNTRGKRITDVWYAALAIEWGCEWITLDRDFARFPGLKWSAPVAPA